MKHNGTKTIETDRLMLREFRVSDASLAYKNWTSDDRVTEFLRWPKHPDVSETERVLRDWIDQYKNLDFYQWAIVLKETDEPIGSISVVEINEKLDSVHVGYCIGSKWWHQGITSEAFAALISYFFDEVGVNRVEAHHDPNNPHSGGVMKKCGLKYEGTLRQADYSNKGIVDAAVYSILKCEWQKREGQK